MQLDSYLEFVRKGHYLEKWMKTTESLYILDAFNCPVTSSRYRYVLTHSNFVLLTKTSKRFQRYFMENRFWIDTPWSNIGHFKLIVNLLTESSFEICTQTSFVIRESWKWREFKNVLIIVSIVWKMCPRRVYHWPQNAGKGHNFIFYIRLTSLKLLKRKVSAPQEYALQQSYLATRTLPMRIVFQYIQNFRAELHIARGKR